MPCFKGLAVSIHTTDGPLPEYSIQKQSRQSRITSYIPVPPPKLSPDSTKPEPASFAISITLLTPGQPVPYSRPSPTSDDPFPNPKIVGALPGLMQERGRYGSVIGPYIPLTSSPNETVAAYIHFDGRAKEEVATLLRPREETWVNSRWVSVPESEGGGLAEREFLFREVGLERWLNGLDLQGDSKEIAARVQKRRERLEKKRRKRFERKGSDDEEEDSKVKIKGENGVLRYGDDKQAPVESLSMDEDGMFDSDSDSDDEMPVPEAAGQIKVSLFRVLASGEIKKGEYSPQFDAHDDDEMGEQGGGGDADVDHTTTFAKPKTLDPKSISTQTVTGIDPTDRPYATFVFFYRGKKQLQKMGILHQPEPAEAKASTSKRKSTRGQVDFSTLGPLKSKGTLGFAGYREDSANGKVKDEDENDSEPEDAEKAGKKSVGKDEDDPLEDDSNLNLTQEEINKRGELAEGVKKIQLKRQHSTEAVTSGTPKPTTPPEDRRDSDTKAPEPSVPATTGLTPALHAPEGLDAIGSPFKKQRASVTDVDSMPKRGLFAGTLPPVSKLASEELKKDLDGQSKDDASAASAPPPESANEKMEDEEL